MVGRKIAVLGGGNGGTAMAADLALAGHSCRIFEFPEYAANIEPIARTGTIKLTGVARTGTAKVERASTVLAEIVDGSELVMVATQALSHQRLAEELVPLLKPGQIVILWPGSAGSIIFRRAADAAGKEGVIVGEAVTLPYCCRRLEGPGTANIHRINGPRIQVAAIPASDTPKIMEALKGVYDTVVPAESIIEPALYNPNIIVHPTGALLNMGRIEYSGGDFWMYKEGITKSVKMVINAMDAERQTIVRALGLKPKTYDEIFEDVYYVPFEKFKAASAKGPFSMQDRYIAEDIPMGAVFTASLGRKLGVPTPTYDAIIHIASVVNGADYARTGRTLEKLGLGGLLPADLKKFFVAGKAGEGSIDRGRGGGCGRRRGRGRSGNGHATRR